MWYSTTTDLLWRNALAIIPLALIVAAICRWGRCRPSTRHALWLGVLIWLIAGLLLPPVSFSTSDKSAVTTDLNTQSPKIGDLDIEFDIDLDIELNLVSSDSEHKSSLGDRHPIREERDPDSEPKLRSLPDPSDIQPTPPETVVRTEPSVPHLLSSADDLVGPLSILGDESVDDDLAVVPASSVPEPVLPPSISKSSPDVYFESQAGSTPAQQAVPEPSHFGQWVNALVAMRDALGQLPTIPPIAWACGLAFILLVRLHRTAHFRRQMQTGAPAPASAIKMVSEAAGAMGLRRIPEVIVVHKRISPMIWCGRRLTLVLPRALWSELDETGRRAVVYHEMAHVRRRDHWVCWIEWTVGAVYWWHPLVWWVRGRLREEAEHCCDAWVTWLLPSGRRAYAEALLKARQFVSEPNSPLPSTGIGIMSGKAKRFARRLTMVMTERVSPSMSLPGIAVALSLVFAGWLATPARSLEPEIENIALAEGNEAAVSSSSSSGRALAPSVGGAVLYSAEQAAAAGADRRGERHTSKVRSNQRKLEDRMKRLEEQLARLSRQIEHLTEVSKKNHEDSHQKSIGLLKKMVEDSRGVLNAKRSRGRGGALRPSRPSGGIIVRTYRLPKGKLEALTNLMIRPDVPARVRRVDGGIELHGSAAEHVAFKAFVDAIKGTNRTAVVEYHLPQGKLKALTKLMVRDDVPIVVSPSEEAIYVHGGPGAQAVFNAFMGLIHPSERSSRVGQAGPRSQNRLAELALAEYQAAAAEKERMAQSAEAAQRVAETARNLALSKLKANEEDREINERRRAVAEMLREVEQLETKVEQLEDEADRLADEADRLRDRADVMRVEAEMVKKSEESEQLQRQAREMEEKADQIEREIRKIRHEAEALELRADDLEAKADEEEERLESLIERGK